MKSLRMENFSSNTGAIVLGGHVQGLGIIRSLGRRGIPVFLVDETRANIGRFSKYCNRFYLEPKMKQEKSLMNFLVTLTKNEGIKGWVLFPTHDSTVETLSRNSEILKGFYRSSVPEWTTTQLAYNKILTYRLAKKIGIPIPQTYFPRNKDELRAIGRRIEFPIIIKPAIMHKFYSKLKIKVYKASNLNELIKKYAKACSIVDPSEIIIQEIIPGSPEALYSCCCFFKQETLMASCIGQRFRQIPMDFGKATTFARSVDIPEIRAYSEKLLSAIGYYGLAEVEFKRDPRDGIFKLLEINPRTWKWHTLAIKAGVDMPFLMYNDLLGAETDKIKYGRIGVKWIELFTDTYVAVREMIKGNLNPVDYLSSFKGDVEFAVASRDDPLPFISYFLLFPYFLLLR